MTDNEMRVKIAELCGWYMRDAVLNPFFRWCHPEYIAPHDPRPEITGAYGCFEPPDYLNDLNAMHEAEKTLTDGPYERYRVDLWNLVTDYERPIHNPCAPTKFERAYLSANPRQRAIAFLKTKLA